MEIPRLVGHRGYPLHQPENTLPALEAAWPGACYLEIDVQLSRDGVPVVIHDADLRRTAGLPGRVLDMDYAALREVVVDERGRLGRPCPGAHLPALAEVVQWLLAHPGVNLFVELKAESLRLTGAAAMVQRVMDVLAPVRDRAVIISFVTAAVREARRAGMPAGWVMPRWGGRELAAAQRLAPEFLFCDWRIVPAGTNLPPGPWRWALYDIVDPQAALDWAARGASLIETWAIGEMLAHPVLAQAACGPPGGPG